MPPVGTILAVPFAAPKQSASAESTKLACNSVGWFIETFKMESLHELPSITITL